jgi:hypothetical protein
MIPDTPVLPELNILLELLLKSAGVLISGMIDAGIIDAGIKFVALFPLNIYISIRPEKMIAISIINPENSCNISVTIDVRYSYGNIE